MKTINEVSPVQPELALVLFVLLIFAAIGVLTFWGLGKLYRRYLNWQRDQDIEINMRLKMRDVDAQQRIARKILAEHGE
jgi:hypothetical protein